MPLFPLIHFSISPKLRSQVRLCYSQSCPTMGTVYDMMRDASSESSDSRETNVSWLPVTSVHERDANENSNWCDPGEPCDGTGVPRSTVRGTTATLDSCKA
jgi:hypothetical protein